MAEKPDNAEPRRRWYQFSLPTMLIGVALVAVACAIGTPFVRRWFASDDFDQIKPPNRPAAIELYDPRTGKIHSMLEWPK